MVNNFNAGFKKQNKKLQRVRKEFRVQRAVQPFCRLLNTKKQQAIQIYLDILIFPDFIYGTVSVNSSDPVRSTHQNLQLKTSGVQ